MRCKKKMQKKLVSENSPELQGGVTEQKQSRAAQDRQKKVNTKDT